MYVKVISILVQSLEVQKLVTRRDIYYQDVELFQDQREVDNCVLNLCSSLQAEDYELGVVASAKGLVLGDYSIKRNDGYQVFSHTQDATVIPLVDKTTTISIPTSVKYVIVVEKEAIFKVLCSQSQPSRILVTGKGFPDVQTRRFLKAIAIEAPHLQMFCLTDSDIYGLMIFWTYKNWSNYSESLDLRSLQYLGVCMTDHDNDMLDISAKDFFMAQSFLSRCALLETEHKTKDPSLAKIKKETQRGMFLLKKAEMNTVGPSDEEDKLMTVSKGFERYIEQKFASKLKYEKVKLLV